MRRILDLYRSIQCFLFRRNRYGVLQPGESVRVEPFRYEINQGDVVHPCVRFIRNGYLGHHWWMVFTPYYKSNPSIENPVLCYSEYDDPNIPPREWRFYCLVNEKPEDGYNSDPSLLYKDGSLYVFWRENYDNSKHLIYRATYAAKVVKGGVESISVPLLVAHDDEEDAETCPCFMPDKNGEVVAYGMHLRFRSHWIKRLKQPWRKWISQITWISDLMGFYSQQRHYGLAIWQQDHCDWLKPYTYRETIKFNNCNALYRPWHMDFFDYEGKRYAVIQTNMSNADICLAWSEDGRYFSFFNKPLITNKSIGKVGIYKPSAGVTPQGTFYLYYTAQDESNRSLNLLYLVQAPFNDLLNRIK